ncbi:MAG: hypothetical protein IJY28_00295 [Clostridia bacterium]|nr:hypothetical protein [Clostridia bacterium]
MNYVTHADLYTYGLDADGISCTEFEQLAWEASRMADRYTTGLDGVRKLRKAFPVDEMDAEAVKRCVCRLILLMHQIGQAEAAGGYTSTENGYHRNQIAAVSAGNESVTYASGGNVSVIASAAADRAVREQLYANTIWAYLSGVADANGVSLLYMGCYPGGVRTC